MKGKGGTFSSLGRARVLETFPFPLKKPGILYVGCNNQFALGKGIQQSWNLDSTQWIPDSGYWFLVAIISGILDSSSYNPDSKGQDFGYHKQIFPHSRLTNKIFRIHLHVAKPKQYFLIVLTIERRSLCYGSKIFG